MDGSPGPLLRHVRNQKAAFLLVGGVNTAAGVAWFVGLQLLLGDAVTYHGVLVLAYLANVLLAFVMYRRLVFRVRGHVLRDLARFVVVNSSSFVVNLTVMTVAVSGLHLPPIPSQLVITPVLAVAVFIGYRDFSFRRRGSDPAPATKVG